MPTCGLASRAFSLSASFSRRDESSEERQRSKSAKTAVTPGEPAAIHCRIRAMGEGEIRRVIVYHPDRLMRQPKDLEELLSIADDKRVLLHGEANRRDLSDPDDRFILRIEVADKRCMSPV
ncbi:recombinase family protein [Streptomyces sp. NPDC058086]|uniref:recombinase family protein n=1 Tax=Streptomyces sp. NPDC058086 TaxID=3346334 RepID=UPI0036F1366C